jgi:hypothetical protein
MQATASTWTTDATGHLVGDDGFVVPRDFAEFYALRPDFALIMARSLLRGADPDRLEDFAQDIWQRLLSNRVVERFDPTRMHGCNNRRFYFYLKVCIVRMSHTRWDVSRREPVTDSAAIVDDSEQGLTEENVHGRRLHPITTLDLTSSIFLDQFRAYIHKRWPHKSDVYLSVLDGIAAGQTQAEIAEGLGVATVHQHIKALRVLAVRFGG